jgi:hypothetical protein
MAPGWQKEVAGREPHPPTLQEVAMRKRTAIRTILVLVALTVGLVTSASPAASQVTTTIDIGQRATLVAKGAAISVPVTVTCEPGQRFWVDVFARQRHAQIIVVGSGSSSGTILACTGSPQTVNVLVFGDRPFHVGSAIATASLVLCTESECFTTPFSDQAEIRVVRR